MMITSFNDFIDKYGSKNKEASIIKLQQTLPYLSLSGLWISLTDGPFEPDIERVNLGSTKGTQWD